MKLNVFLLLISNSLVLSGQESVSLVLDKYKNAIGGQDNISKIQSIYSFANCVSGNGKYQTELFSAKNSKTLFRQIWENKTDYIGVVNGDFYWTKAQESKLSDKKTAYVWRSHEIQWVALHPEERFNKLEFAGYESFDGQPAIKLSGSDDLDNTVFLYFDKDNYILLGLSLLNPLSEIPETIQLNINDWKVIDKLLLPSKVTFKDKQGDFVLNFETIEINGIEDSIFAIPTAIIAQNELMELHDVQRRAHFGRDAGLLVSIMSEDFIEINNGKINTPKKEELIKRFQSYFDAVTFIEWDDINPPVIKISDDLSMAYMAVNKKVRLKTLANIEEETIFAWISTFKKVNDTWKMTSIASTAIK